MKKLILGVVAGAFVVSAFGLARADTLAGTVQSYDTEKHVMTLVTGEIVELHKYMDVIPEGLSADDEIVMEFTSSEDGFTGITSLKITADR